MDSDAELPTPRFPARHDPGAWGKQEFQEVAVVGGSSVMLRPDSFGQG